MAALRVRHVQFPWGFGNEDQILVLCRCPEEQSNCRCPVFNFGEGVSGRLGARLAVQVALAVAEAVGTQIEVVS